VIKIDVFEKIDDMSHIDSSEFIVETVY